MSQIENDRADPAAAVVAPATTPDPVRPRSVIRTLLPILGVWLALLIVGYAISFQSLTWAIILLLLIGFAVSTVSSTAGGTKFRSTLSKPWTT